MKPAASCSLPVLYTWAVSSHTWLMCIFSLLSLLVLFASLPSTVYPPPPPPTLYNSDCNLHLLFCFMYLCTNSCMLPGSYKNECLQWAVKLLECHLDEGRNVANQPWFNPHVYSTWLGEQNQLLKEPFYRLKCHLVVKLYYFTILKAINYMRKKLVKIRARMNGPLLGFTTQ